MSTLPKISVVIPSYNSMATISECLRSLLGGAFQSIEIIVVDDCSTDDSPNFVETLSQIESRVKLLRMSVNGGPAKARNAGAKRAIADWIFFLDSDTVAFPDTLEVFYKKRHMADAIIGIYDAEPLNDGIVPLYKALLNNYFFSRLGEIPYEVFDSSRAGIKKSVFESLGGFNETLAWGMDYENEELGYRLCEQGASIMLVPSISVKHTFPGFANLTNTYFWRVCLWFEVFIQRKKFESGGVTSTSTGIASAGILAALLTLVGFVLVPAGTAANALLLATVLFFAMYVYGYLGFFNFVLKRRPMMVPLMALCNMYFTVVIACGASYGLLRSLFGLARVREIACPPK